MMIFSILQTLSSSCCFSTANWTFSIVIFHKFVKHGDFPQQTLSLPEATYFTARGQVVIGSAAPRSIDFARPRCKVLPQFHSYGKWLFIVDLPIVMLSKKLIYSYFIVDLPKMLSNIWEVWTSPSNTWR